MLLQLQIIQDYLLQYKITFFISIFLLIQLCKQLLSNNTKINIKLIKHSTIIITGASSGIGYGFVHFFAKQNKNYKIMLVARRQEELEKLKSEIILKYKYNPDNILVVPTDLSNRNSTDNLLESIKQVSENKIGCFVNCAGLTHRIPNELINLAQQEIDQILTLHVVQTTYLIKQISIMFEKQKCGLFIQLCSGVGIYGQPMLSVYSASKTYLNMLLKTINEEARVYNAHFVAACPFWVATPMTMTKKQNMLFISPDKFIKLLFKNNFTKNTVINPYILHRFVQYFIGAMPERLRMNYLYSQMVGIRAKIIKKLKKTQK